MCAAALNPRTWWIFYLFRHPAHPIIKSVQQNRFERTAWDLSRVGRVLDDG